jgi:hypothetical protein
MRSFPITLSWGVLDRLCPDPVRVLREIAETAAHPLPGCGTASRRYRILCDPTVNGVLSIQLVIVPNHLPQHDPIPTGPAVSDHAAPSQRPRTQSCS